MTAVTVRRKPKQTTAIQWTGTNYEAVVRFSGGFIFERMGDTLRTGVTDVLPLHGWLVRHVGMSGAPFERTWFVVDDRTFREQFEVVVAEPVAPS